MGMTNDEAIKYLRALKRCETCEAGKPCSCYRIGTLSKCYDAIDVGIKTMHKYQKIEQIIKNYDTAWEFHTLRDTIDKIREVIEGQLTHHLKVMGLRLPCSSLANSYILSV